jgi:hypothetical protein
MMVGDVRVAIFVDAGEFEVAAAYPNLTRAQQDVHDLSMLGRSQARDGDLQSVRREFAARIARTRKRLRVRTTSPQRTGAIIFWSVGQASLAIAAWPSSDG